MIHKMEQIRHTLRPALIRSGNSKVSFCPLENYTVRRLRADVFYWQRRFHQHARVAVRRVVLYLAVTAAVRRIL